MAVPPNFASSILVDASAAAPQEPLGIDEAWAPPTPDEWDRALRILALQVVREIARRCVSLPLLRMLGSSVKWR